MASTNTKFTNSRLISGAGIALLVLSMTSLGQAGEGKAKKTYQDFKQTLRCVDGAANAAEIQVIRLNGKFTGKINVVSLTSKKRESAPLHFKDPSRDTGALFANLKDYRYEIDFDAEAFNGTKREDEEKLEGQVGFNDCVAPYYHGQACGWWGPKITCLSKSTDEIKKGLGLILWPTFDETDLGVKPSEKDEYIHIFGAVTRSSADAAGFNSKEAPNTLVAIEMDGQWVSSLGLTRTAVRSYIAKQPLGAEINVKVATRKLIEQGFSKELFDERTLKLKVELMNAFFN
jgi:hypothetical protein